MFFFISLDSSGPCNRRTCNHNSYCVESGNLAYCECPVCDLHYAPVCGSNGITYNNECLLKKASCTMEKDIEIAGNGPCSKLRCIELIPNYNTF